MFYVVTKGEYSCYHIVAVTTNRGVAEQIANKFGGEYSWDRIRIEEYEDGEVMLKPAWIVTFDRAGNAVQCEACEDEYYYKCIGRAMERGRGYDRTMCCHVSADTEEAAIKIAAEKRAMYLAEKNGL